MTSSNPQGTPDGLDELANLPATQPAILGDKLTTEELHTIRLHYRQRVLAAAWEYGVPDVEQIEREGKFLNAVSVEALLGIFGEPGQLAEVAEAELGLKKLVGDTIMVWMLADKAKAMIEAEGYSVANTLAEPLMDVFLAWHTRHQPGQVGANSQDSATPTAQGHKADNSSEVA